jgi:hypothetical protein
MLENYETVAERLARWLDTKHDGQPRVITHLVSNPGDDVCVFRAELWVDGTLISTGWAEEIRGQGNVNKTSHLENCESSALGRALANAGLAGSDPARRPSREEMGKVQRSTSSSAPQHTGTKTITNKMKGKCVDCGGTVDIGEGLATNDGSGWKTHHRPNECPPEAF